MPQRQPIEREIRNARRRPEIVLPPSRLAYRPVLTILQHNLDGQPLPEPEAPATAGTTHENVRGRDYYH
jgi:hypothetical protein